MACVVNAVEVYLDEPDVKVTWIADQNCLRVEWKAQPSAESYQQVLAMQQHIIRKHHCTKLFFDTKALRNNTSQVN